MSHGPGGPPPFGPPPQLPPQQPPPAAPTPAAPSGSGDAPTGTVRLLVIATAGLGLLVYLVSFFGYGLGQAGLALLGGGLLMAGSLLPRGGRALLLPGAVLVVTGALLLLQGAILTGLTAVIALSFIVAILQAGAAACAYLMDVGLLKVSSGQGRAPQGYGYGPPGYGPPPQAPGYAPPGPPPAPGFGGPGEWAPPQGGWAPPAAGPQLTKPGEPPESDVERTEIRADNSATAAIPVVTDGPPPEDGMFGKTTVSRQSTDEGAFGKTTVSRPPADEGVFGKTTMSRPPADEGVFGKTTASRPPRPAEPRSATGSMPAANGHRPSDQTSVFDDGGMFTESAGEGRHGQPDGERPSGSVPPDGETWFMPPGDRPNN